LLVRHKDIKAQNVLLHQTPAGTNLLLTDFGLAMDFSEIAKSTTDGPLPQRTERYCAPEVARGLPRGRRSDVYSMGCLLIEVATVVMGYDLKTLDEWLGGDAIFYDSEPEIASWISKLQREDERTTAILLKWIGPMMRKRPSQRPQMQTVVDEILDDGKVHKELRSQLFCKVCMDELRKQSRISGTGTKPIDNARDSDYGSGKIFSASATIPTNNRKMTKNPVTCAQSPSMTVFYIQPQVQLSKQHRTKCSTLYSLARSVSTWRSLQYPDYSLVTSCLL
jgi:serine/threonine protein kinase